MKIVRLIPTTGPAYAVFGLWHEGKPALQEEVVQAWALYEGKFDEQRVVAMVAHSAGDLVVAKEQDNFIAVVNVLPAEDAPGFKEVAERWFVVNQDAQVNS